MRIRYALSIAILILCSSFTSAKGPKWTKKSRSAICQVIAYDEKGNETGRATGFFTDSEGNGVTEYDLFSNAVKAVAIDSRNQSHDIHFVIGANRIYNIARFNITPDKYVTSLPLSDIPAVNGDKLYVMPYSEGNSSQPLPYTVAMSSGMADNFTYYTLDGILLKDIAGSPLLNEEGQVVAIVQNAVETDTCNYAADIRFATSLAISSAFTLNDDNYRGMRFPKSLPDNEEQALVYLYMNQGGDQSKYRELLDQFIGQYPGCCDGYLRKGSFLVSSRDSTLYREGVSCLDKAVSIADNKDYPLYEYAHIIYCNVTSPSLTKMFGWTLESALEKIDEAISIEDTPSYQELKGNILFSSKRYAEALACFDKLDGTSMATPETYYYKSVIKGKMEVDDDEIIATLDSAVNFYGRPYTTTVAPFILERATIKEGLQRYREAVIDLNEYEQIIGTTGLTAEFFYFREQVEVKAKMYEQALNDILRAAEMEPSDFGFSLECASLLIRVGKNDDAKNILEKLIAVNQDDTDCLRLLGICLMQSGEKEKAKTYLEKAKSLGDEMAARLLESDESI